MSSYTRLNNHLALCPTHRIELTGIWVVKGMCAVCWAKAHPLRGYCMLCGEPLSNASLENTLCQEHEAEFRALFGKRKLKVPFRTVEDVRSVVAFTALKIFSNVESWHVLVENKL